MVEKQYGVQKKKQFLLKIFHFFQVKQLNRFTITFFDSW